MRFDGTFPVALYRLVDCAPTLSFNCTLAMSPIHWTRDNDVGNEFIDEQHKQWVIIFNDLEKSLLQPDEAPSDTSQLELLKDVLDFTREHFLDEERLMIQHRYPDIVRHRRMHKDFELQVYEKYRMVMAGEIVLTSEILALIRHWFINHTGSEDRKTFSYINARTNEK